MPTVHDGQTPAAWFPDPFVRHERRYWDGIQWTHHVASRGFQGVDPPFGHAIVPPVQQAVAPSVSRPTRKVERQVRKAGAGGGQAGGRTLFTERVLVVNQKAKLIGSTLGYAVYDQQGHQLATFQEVRRDLTTKVSDRMRGRRDADWTLRFQVVDMDGQVLLAMTRPELGIMSKSAMIIEGPGGRPLGQISQETTGLLGAAATALGTGIEAAPAIALLGLGGVGGLIAGTALDGVTSRMSSATEGLKKVGHVRFGLDAGGQRLGSIHAVDTSAWDFTIQDPTGTEIAEVTKTWAGWSKERFTKADNYVVQIHRPLEDPLHSLVIAATLALDIALKQGEQTRKNSVWSTRHYK